MGTQRHWKVNGELKYTRIMRRMLIIEVRVREKDEACGVAGRAHGGLGWKGERDCAQRRDERRGRVNDPVAASLGALRFALSLGMSRNAVLRHSRGSMWAIESFAVLGTGTTSSSSMLKSWMMQESAQLGPRRFERSLAWSVSSGESRASVARVVGLCAGSVMCSRRHAHSFILSSSCERSTRGRGRIVERGKQN